MSEAIKVVVAFGAIFAVALPSTSFGTTLAPGDLVVREKRVESDRVYFEGYYKYLKVRKVASGSVVVQRSWPGGRRMHLRKPLESGRYEVISYERSCVGTCERRDPPSNRCSETLRLEPDQELRVRVRTKTGYPCRIRTS